MESGEDDVICCGTPSSEVCDKSEMDDHSLTSGSLSPDPMVDLTDETPAKPKALPKPIPMIDLCDETAVMDEKISEKTATMPTPEPIGKFKVDETNDLNTSTNSLPGKKLKLIYRFLNMYII